MRRKFLESLKLCLTLQEKWFCVIFLENWFVFIEKILYFQALYHYSIVQKIRFTFLEEFKNKFTGNSNMRKHFQGFASFSEKWLCTCRPIYMFLSLAPMLDHFEDWS